MRAPVAFSTIVLLVVLGFPWIGYPEETSTEKLAIEQKLQRLYELYRVGETVSLSRREMRFSLGVAYAVDEESLLGVRASSSGVSLSASFAYGLTNWLEVAASVPIQWNQTRIESGEQRLADQSIVGFGGIGLRVIAAIPTKDFETTAILSLNLPTGREELQGDRLFTLIGLNVAKVMRPAFVFGGLGWQRDWDKGIDGIAYSGGVGFFLNHTLSLGLEINGTRFINPPRGSAFDVVSVTSRLTYQATPTFGIAPFLTIGLTDSAPDAVVGANLLWRF